MLAITGHIILLLALVVCVCCAGAFFVGTRKGHSALIMIARNGVFLIAALFTSAVAIMMYAFVTKDFSLKIVAEHASKDLPTAYAFTALYADKAGSVLFWGWLTSLFVAILTFQKSKTHEQIMHYALAILAIVMAVFALLVTVPLNVFEKIPVPPADGFGLNPLLQNFGMLVHPPLLYIGFAGFAIVFAFVIGALIARSPSAEWIRGIRRWTLFAWCMLGLGNLVGAWWAYIELGWGGYWAWDPVENAGLMPWFLGTAFLHSIALQRYKHYLHVWSFVLITLTFTFVLLSPFITHGGIESVLHGFVGSPLPPYILGSIIVTLVGSLWLLYIRYREFASEDKPSSLFSREGAFLLANIIFVIVVALMIAGTVLPRLVEAMGGRKMALEREFFDFSCGPILLIMVFFMGVCPLLGWKKASWHSMKNKFAFSLLISLGIAVVLLISGIGTWYAVAALICGFPLFTVFIEWFQGTRARHFARSENYLQAFSSLVWSNKPRHGGFIVHIGIIFITLGVIGSSMYDIEKTQTLNIGETMTIQKYDLTFTNLDMKRDLARVNASASLSVSRGDKTIDVLHPQNNYWFRADNYYAEVATRTTLADDLFVVLAGYDREVESVTIRAKVNPLIVWLWIGGAFILMGGIIAFWPDRKRQSQIAHVSSAKPAVTDEDDDIERQIRDLRLHKNEPAPEMEHLRCPKCGGEHKLTDKFCASCGTRLVL